MDEDNSNSAPQEQTPEPSSTISEVDVPVSQSPEQPIIAQPEPENKPKVFQPPKQSKPKKKWLWLLLLLVIIAAVAFWWLVLRSSKSTSNNSANSSQTQTLTIANTFTPATVAYAFKDTDTSPYTLYWRLASGGDRTPVDQKLTTSEPIVSSDVYGSNVAVATSKALYVSTDNGKTYKSIVKLDNDEQVTSIKLSTDGQKIVYGDLAAGATSDTVKTVDLSGGNSKELFTSTKRAVSIIGYSSARQQIIYREYTGLEGAADLPVLRDLKTNKTTNLVSGPTVNELADIAVSNDFSTLIFAKSTQDLTVSEQATGVFTGAPYTINTVDLSSDKTTQITTFGTKGEKNTNGTLRTRWVHVGFVAGTSTPYYSNDGQLYELKSGTPSLVYEASKPLIYVPFVGTDVIMAGSGDQTADYALINYNINSKKSTTIFSGDNNTVLLGVTTR